VIADDDEADAEIGGTGCLGLAAVRWPEQAPTFPDVIDRRFVVESVGGPTRNDNELKGRAAGNGPEGARVSPARRTRPRLVLHEEEPSRPQEVHPAAPSLEDLPHVPLPPAEEPEKVQPEVPLASPKRLHQNAFEPQQQAMGLYTQAPICAKGGSGCRRPQPTPAALKGSHAWNNAGGSPAKL